ncbi:hypothetical protein RclHR1_07720003 [Rhizophagus clarus]|uniref:Uncharacterized protein n=1 Tax=Rhizophagus clarus TaxID=94130 RepID=A0A2Z6SLZ5_9GLOM|nr:hypothetical protein RclHR1_07720003 [Rhizophagus clarus]GET02270.1 hypothetical protein GLOIN_2v1806926 [Rhizophagus clarus]
MKPFFAGISDRYLRAMTCKARKINKIFGYEYDPVSLEKNNGIGWGMIHRVTCSADSISKLTNSQIIEYIIDQVKSKPLTIRDESKDDASADETSQAKLTDNGDDASKVTVEYDEPGDDDYEVDAFAESIDWRD